MLGRFILLLLAAIVVAFPNSALAQISLPGRQNFDFEVSSGETRSSSVEVRNASDQTQAVRVYQTDYSFTPGGEVYGEPGTSARSNADWIRFSPSAFVLEPGESISVHYSIDVPDAALAGSFWSMLMIEGQPIEALSEAGQPDDLTLHLNVVMRFGVQIHTKIPGSAGSDVAIADAKLLRGDDSSTTLRIDVQNTGEDMAGPRAWTELYDANGTQIAKIERPPLRIYPGTVVRYDFELGDVAVGSYEALVVIDAGGDEIYGGQYTLEL